MSVKKLTDQILDFIEHDTDALIDILKSDNIDYHHKLYLVKKVIDKYPNNKYIRINNIIINLKHLEMYKYKPYRNPFAKNSMIEIMWKKKKYHKKLIDNSDYNSCDIKINDDGVKSCIIIEGDSNIINKLYDKLCEKQKDYWNKFNIDELVI